MPKQSEVWMRGPIEGVPGLLQPVAHALLQANEDVKAIMQDFPDSKLWHRPAGVASVGFHLQHMRGVIDRMFTYSRGNTLNESQFADLHNEGIESSVTTQQLVQQFNTQVDKAIDLLRVTRESTLLEPRGIGRKQIPSTVGGLLFHSAEHIQRHLGQLLVTARLLS